MNESEAQITDAFLAWRRNEIVQVYSETDKVWRDFPPSSTIHRHYILRRQPQPKLRPWKIAEVPIGARVRSGTCEWIGSIVGATSEGFIVFVRTAWLVPWSVGKEYSFSTDGGKTWLPAGTLEESP